MMVLARTVGRVALWGGVRLREDGGGGPRERVRLPRWWGVRRHPGEGMSCRVAEAIGEDGGHTVVVEL